MSSLSTAAWHKSGRSTNGGDCAEVTIVPADDPSVAQHKAASGGKELYVLRDSKDPDGPKLYFTDAEWEAFVGGVKDGEFDVPPSASIPNGDDASEPSGAPFPEEDDPRDAQRSEVTAA